MSLGTYTLTMFARQKNIKDRLLHDQVWVVIRHKDEAGFILAFDLFESVCVRLLVLINLSKNNSFRGCQRKVHTNTCPTWRSNQRHFAFSGLFMVT